MSDSLISYSLHTPVCTYNLTHTQTGATERSKTHQQLRTVLCHEEFGPEADVFAYYRKTTDYINNNNTEEIKAIVKNSLWIDGGVSPTYIESCKTRFNSEVLPLSSAEAINTWIEKITEGVIKDLLKQKVCAAVLFRYCMLYAGSLSLCIKHAFAHIPSQVDLWYWWTRATSSCSGRSGSTRIKRDSANSLRFLVKRSRRQ